MYVSIYVFIHLLHYESEKLYIYIHILVFKNAFSVIIWKIYILGSLANSSVKE